MSTASVLPYPPIIQVHLKKIRTSWRKYFFFLLILISKSETFIYSRFIACKVKHFKSFFCFHFDDYSLQLMKVKNPDPKILEYFLRSIKKRICKTEKYKFFKVCSFMHSILGRGSFSTNSSISEVWNGSDQPVALLRHYWVFSLSGLLDPLFLIVLLKISHRYRVQVRHVGWPWSTVISWSAKPLGSEFGTVGRC